MTYGYTKEVPKDFDGAVEAVKRELAKVGFGVLFELDVAGILKQKVGAELGRYVILGACNPPLAYKALLAEQEIGLLLPCNVIVYQKGDKVFVSGLMPTAAMGLVDNAAVQEVAKEAEVKLVAAIDAL